MIESINRGNPINFPKMQLAYAIKIKLNYGAHATVFDSYAFCRQNERDV